MNVDKRRVLVVVDGSYQSYEMVNYVSGVLPPAGSKVILFHISSRVPEAFWDLEEDPVWRRKVQTVRGWEAQQQKKINDFMERALQVLTDAGFPPEAIKVVVREREEGIARDIVEEARKGGYEAVAMGRRGLSALQELSLGGVAAKLVLKLSDIPVWLVGGRPETEGIVIGLDSSAGSLLAVDHVAVTTGGAPRRVLLLHVIRSLEESWEGPEEVFTAEYRKKRAKEAEDLIQPVFEEAKKRLIAAGFPPEKISVKIVTEAASRAGAILDEAKAGDCGTIAIGRRGISMVKEFDMGRVGAKLIQTAKDRAVWVVG